MLKHFLHHIDSQKNLMNGILCLLLIFKAARLVVCNNIYYHHIYQLVFIRIILVNCFFGNPHLQGNFVHSNRPYAVLHKKNMGLLFNSVFHFYN